MANIDKYLSAIAIGSEVSSETNNISDAFKAGAYSAWVESITGQAPTVINTAPNKVKIVMNQTQIKKMQKWLESQMVSALTPKDKIPNVQYELGPAFKPVVLKYAIPSAIVLLIAGYITGKIL